MAGKINREEFLRALESVTAGLSTRDIIEQSSCFVFDKGQVYTFNDEISCRCPTRLDDKIVGAVPAEKLLNILRKLPDEELKASVKEGHLVFSGANNRKSKHRLEAEIALPRDAVEIPEEWTSLPEEFGDAVQVVHQCAGTDQNEFLSTCVHITSKWVEAGDNHQFCRWKIKTNIKQSTLVRGSSLKHISTLGVNEFSETTGWLHFRNAAGVILSCRRTMDDYPSEELTKLMTVDGETIDLPKRLVEVADRGNEFSSENQDNNQVILILKNGRIKVEGLGVTGSYEEDVSISWTGPDMKFLISPKLLMDLVKRHSSFKIAPGKLKVESGAMKYLCCLGETSENTFEGDSSEEDSLDEAAMDLASVDD